MPRRDRTIARSVPLAVRDHGGDGPAVLLLHGLGGTLDAWDEVAPLLTPAHRVLAMDLRGHGRSGDGPWRWDAVLDDIEAVAAELGSPAVAGHSLGGMLAVQWALRHPECPAIVDLDGLRSAESTVENYPGMAPEAVREEVARLRAAFDAQAAAMADPLPAERIGTMPERALVTRNGATYLRPDATLLAEVRYTPEFRDTIPYLREVRCPALVVLPTADPPSAPGGELMAAFRRGVRRDLAALAATMPNLRVVEVDGSHDMLAERPAEIAELISGAVASA